MLDNKHNTIENGSWYSKNIFSVLKLLKTVFCLRNILDEYQVRCPNHFVVKSLSSISVLVKSNIQLEVNNDLNKDRLLVSLLAVIERDQPVINDSPPIAL